LERDAPGAARHGAWLLGAAIAFQPLAVLGVAPVLARLGWRKVAALSYCVVVPSVVVLIAPLAGEAHRTISVLVRQPFQPSAVSSTPLSHWAPTLGPGVAGGGPARLVATVLGVLVCVAVCRRRFDLETVLAMMSIAFFLRVLFETELNWYYVWPVAALCVLLARRPDPVLDLCRRSGGQHGAGQSPGPPHRALVARPHGHPRRHADDRVRSPRPVAGHHVHLLAPGTRAGRRVRRHDSAGGPGP
jgi:hypothetical protein